MAKFCECCGSKNNIIADPFYLTNDKILCNKCAEPIRADINNLYYVQSSVEYEEMKNSIILKCKNCFNDTITEYCIALMDKIYERLDLKADNNYSPANQQIPSPNQSVVNTSKTETSAGMFDNIGGKIKTLAQVITWLGIITSIISGIAIISIGEMLLFLGVIVIIFGSILSWVSSFVLYAFGQLVENSDKLLKIYKN